MMPIQLRAARFASIALGLVIGLLLAEVVARIEGGYGRHKTAIEKLQKNRSPNLWVGPESLRRAAERSGQEVIVALGDSFTNGVALPLQETWPKRLQEDLQGRSGDPVLVLNLGKPHSGLSGQRRLLGEVLEVIRPSFVVHQLFINDYTSWEYPDETIPMYAGPDDPVVCPDLPLQSLFYLWRARNAYPIFRPSFLEHLQAYGRPGRHQWLEVSRDYAALRSELESRGIGYAPFLVPALVWKNGRYPLREFHRSVGAAMREASPRYFDLLSPAEEEFASGYDYWLDRDAPDAHPNAEMHGFIAREVSRRLPAVRDLAPPSSAP